MHLEEAAADVGEEGAREVVDEDGDALVQHLALGRALDAHVVDAREGGQRELVHAVDGREARDDEVEDGAARGHGPVELARGGDLARRHLGVLHAHADGVRGDLGLAERVDELLVVKDVALAVGEHLQDLVLDVLERLLVRADGDDERVLLGLEVGALEAHHVDEQLVLEAAQRHSEVDDRHLDAHLGHVVRVGQLGRDVELEVVAVGHVAVAEAQQQLAALLEGLLQQHGLERRVELLLDVLAQHGLPVADGVLERAQEVRLRQLDDLQLVLLVHVLDPAVRLPLRVDHERPAPAHGREHAVLGRELVGRQAHHVPEPHLHRVAQQAHEREARVDRHVELRARVDPAADELLPELRVEGADVCGRGGRGRAGLGGGAGRLVSLGRARACGV